MKEMFLLAGSGLGFGVAITTAVYMIIHERLLNRSLDRREREFYAPVLQRTEQHEATVRKAVPPPAAPPPPPAEDLPPAAPRVRPGAPGGISLAAFPLRRAQPTDQQS
jgi:hypothetical protein